MQAPIIRTLEIGQLPLWERLKQKRTPLGFNLEITARCNNNCRHCYINIPAEDAIAKQDELSQAEILNIAGQAVEMGAVWCLVTGGEPLLRADFPDIYLALKRLGLLVGVFSNATLIGESHVCLFRKYPPRNLEITVYGISRQTYETVTRREGSFDAFQRGLGLLLQNAVPVNLKAMALRSNYHELGQVADYCRSHTRGFYRFDPQLHLRYDRDLGRNIEIRAERLKPEEIVAAERSDPERFPALRKRCDQLLHQDAKSDCDHLFHCGAGLADFSVSYDGIFRLCDSLWAPGTTYDLRGGSLKEAWSDHVPKVRQLRSRNAEYLRTCRLCPIIDLCFSCPANNWLETGKMDGETPYFCAVAQARVRLLEESA